MYLCFCHEWGVCTRHFSHGQCWSSNSSRRFYYKPVLCPDIGRSPLWLCKKRVVFEHALLQEVKSLWSIMPDNARDHMSWSLRLDHKRNMRQDLTMQSHLRSLPHRCRFFLFSFSLTCSIKRHSVGWPQVLTGAMRLLNKFLPFFLVKLRELPWLERNKDDNHLMFFILSILYFRTYGPLYNLGYRTCI